MNENEDLKRVAQQTILHAMEQVTDEIEYVADNAVADSEKEDICVIEIYGETDRSVHESGKAVKDGID